MGLLDAFGAPLSWAESKKHSTHVQEHGVEQFISIYENNKDIKDSPFLWGDEVEYFVCALERDEEVRSSRLPVRAPELLQHLNEDPMTSVPPGGEGGNGVVWHPEYANWMIEATPAHPFAGSAPDLLQVEKNMQLRRSILTRHLKGDEVLVSLPVYPRLGAASFAGKLKPNPEGEISRSLYIPDESIQPHPRFPTLTSNIRKRRGEKVVITVPVFEDLHTHRTLDLQAEEIRAQPGGEDIIAGVPANSIYMDAMAFGMGAGCLQVTFQASDLGDAREMYDQLAVMAPIMLALTAASPVWKGVLADIDARWDIISASVDDRTAGERGVAPLSGNEQRIFKSRYSSIDTYISGSDLNRSSFNDVPAPVNSKALKRLQEAGIDAQLAKHVAHLFIRDPLVVYEAKLEQDDQHDNDHFENIQSTNWNTVRFKPPPANNPHDIKWRVEFRSMEVNLTDFENAAFSVFMILLTKAIKSQRLDLYMPLSKVDENMARAHRRGAALNERFHFRQHVERKGGFAAADPSPVVAELSLDQIINGDAAAGVTGLKEFIVRHLDAEGCTGEVRARLDKYLELVGARASGALPTAAAWIREFVVSHPGYGKDSVVSEEICHDLMRECAAVGGMTGRVSELIGTVEAPSSVHEAAQASPPPCGADSVLSSSSSESSSEDEFGESVEHELLVGSDSALGSDIALATCRIRAGIACCRKLSHEADSVSSCLMGQC